jgi:2-C-methyl-D-erythritol 4-phosphate cytidylyltransferase
MQRPAATAGSSIGADLLDSTMDRTVGVVIAAAGRGERLGLGVPKAFVALAGEPMVMRTLGLCASAGFFGRAVVAVPQTHITRFRELLAAGGPWPFPVEPVIGGEDRQESVSRSLAVLGDDCEIVVIHDAVRPLASARLFLACVESARRCGAAVAAVPVRDTLKRAAGEHVTATVEREGLWMVQTPQAFRLQLLREAHGRAVETGYRATDDAALVERAGGAVQLVRGEEANIKITEPGDLCYAELVLRAGALS